MKYRGPSYRDFNAVPFLLQVYDEIVKKMGKTVYDEIRKKMGKTFLLLKENLLLEECFRNLQSKKFNFILCLLLYPHFNKRALKNISSAAIAEQSISRAVAHGSEWD